MGIVACEINFQSATHIPTFANLLEMSWTKFKKGLNLSAFG